MLGKHRILEYAEIAGAQSISKSESEASKKLGVNFAKYRRYAKMYGLFGRVKNQSGKGTKRPVIRYDVGKYPLTQIIKENKFPNYSSHKLKLRCVRAKFLEEKCDLCGINEKRVFDNRTPLILNYRDQDSKNKLLDNLQLLCYNCHFYNNNNPIGKKVLLRYDD